MQTFSSGRPCGRQFIFGARQSKATKIGFTFYNLVWRPQLTLQFASTLPISEVASKVLHLAWAGTLEGTELRDSCVR